MASKPSYAHQQPTRVEFMVDRFALAARCTASVTTVILCGQGAPTIILATRTPIPLCCNSRGICQGKQFGGIPHNPLVEPPTACLLCPGVVRTLMTRRPSGGASLLRSTSPQNKKNAHYELDTLYW
jgi:hypothetical protein